MKPAIFIAIFIAILAAVGVFSGDSQEEVVVTNFDECVEAGNAVMESFPRQCAHGGTTYVEDVEAPIPPVGTEEEGVVVTCDPNNRPEACIKEYIPVCGLVEVQCVTTPCNPVPQTFGNGCSACATPNVISYTEGECAL